MSNDTKRNKEQFHLRAKEILHDLQILSDHHDGRQFKHHGNFIYAGHISDQHDGVGTIMMSPVGMVCLANGTAWFKAPEENSIDTMVDDLIERIEAAGGHVDNDEDDGKYVIRKMPAFWEAKVLITHMEATWRKALIETGLLAIKAAKVVEFMRSYHPSRPLAAGDVRFSTNGYDITATEKAIHHA